MALELSVVIPTLNEEAHIEQLLASLRRQQGIELDIIVTDGGSTDKTCERAENGGARVVHAPRGRGAQMNAACEHVKHELLLFLHADSIIDDERLVERALDHFRCALESRESKRVAGHFPLRFVREDSRRSFGYFYYERKTSLGFPQTINGDQGLLIAHSFFESLGGFSEEMGFLEDQKIAARIEEEGVWVLLPGTLGTSARRFEEEGFSERMVLSAIIMALYTIGYQPFFERAREVYREQSDSVRLELSGFFRLIFRLNIEDGLPGAVRHWIAIGEYVRRNAWQLFFLVDAWNEFRDRRDAPQWLRCHDRFFAPLTAMPLGAPMTALLTYIWFLGAWARYEFQDRHA